MNIERHGHVMPMPNKARCGGPAICEVCQREQRYEAGRVYACRIIEKRAVPRMVDEMLTAAFMAGAEWKP